MVTSDEAVILASKLSKVHNPERPDRVVAVDRVSVVVGRGEAVALQGPSGSGKTTLLSLIGCMTRPTSGRIMVNGRDVAKLGEERVAALQVREHAFAPAVDYGF